MKTILLVMLLSLLIACQTTTNQATGNVPILVSRSSDLSMPSINQVSTTDVNIERYSFSPATAIISQGATIRWINNDNNEVKGHRIASKDGYFDSGYMNYGESYRYTFSDKGVYFYYCKIHPLQWGKIVVQ
jgi:plastocyanin